MTCTHNLRKSQRKRETKQHLPAAKYSRVTTLYNLPPFSRLIGSTSTRPPLALTCLPLEGGSSSVSSVSHTPKTLFPGSLRESQETRMPEMTGKRLYDVQQCKMGTLLNISLTPLEQAMVQAKPRGYPKWFDRRFQERRWDLRREGSP